MQPGANSLETPRAPREPEAYDSSSLELPVTSRDLSTPLAPTGSTPVSSGNLSPFRYNRRAFLVTTIALAVILLIGAISFAINHFAGKQPSGDKPVASYSVGSVSLSGVKADSLQIGGASHLEIN